ncbi:hypothetical protein SGPA1_50706 [Streptomyces misionensis JCM 4497]
MLAGGVPVPAPPSDHALHPHHRGPGLLPGPGAQQRAGETALRAPGDAVRDPGRCGGRRGDLRDVPDRPAPLRGLRLRTAGGGDQRRHAHPVPDLHVGAGDHRPPLHLVAGDAGGRDGRGLPAGARRTGTPGLLRAEAGRPRHAVDGGGDRGGGGGRPGVPVEVGRPPLSRLGRVRKVRAARAVGRRW